MKDRIYKYKVKREVVTVIEQEVEGTLGSFIGDIVKEKRLALQISQNRLAGLCGGEISGSLISKMEAGCVDNLPNLNTLVLLGEVLDMHLTDFFPPRSDSPIVEESVEENEVEPVRNSGPRTW